MCVLDAAPLFTLILEWIFIIPAVAGSVYGIMCLFAVTRFMIRPSRLRPGAFAVWPPVTILKPVQGLEKDLRENLRSACRQDYPDFQVVLSVQGADDPAIHLLRQIQNEFGPERVSVAVEERRAGPNGKINNLIGALAHARHEILVISDSDVRLRPDYLKTIIAPLADPDVGYVCTLYKASGARNFFEKMILLTLNADLVPNMIFAHVSGASRFAVGASTALRRSALWVIGGFEALADYLAEDNEMGRRIRESGRQAAIVPYLVETIMDLAGATQWWGHQLHWDQCNRSARRGAYFASVVVRAVPFALLFALVRLGDATGLAVLAGALLVRLGTAAVILGWGLRDREGMRNLWLLPLRDVIALVSWALAYTQPGTRWRGQKFTLTRDGRLISRTPQP